MYDLKAGGENVARFLPSEGHVSNNYELTNLCMSAGGALVCYDGVLWDARRMNRPIHKFDKLSAFGWGALHPNGLQLMLDKDVWDLRTYRIAQSCSIALHGSSFRFDPFGEVIYSYRDHAMSHNVTSEVDSTFNKSVVVTDATNYSSIASWNVDRTVYDLGVHPSGRCAAIVVKATNSYESECRLYEIGRSTVDDDEADLDDAQVYPESLSEQDMDEDMYDSDEVILDDMGGTNNFSDVIMRAINAISHDHETGDEGEFEDGEDDEEFDEDGFDEGDFYDEEDEA
jgi:HIV-1 Vpr-binding protein